MIAKDVHTIAVYNRDGSLLALGPTSPYRETVLHLESLETGTAAWARVISRSGEVIDMPALGPATNYPEHLPHIRLSTCSLSEFDDGIVFDSFRCDFPGLPAAEFYSGAA